MVISLFTLVQPSKRASGTGNNFTASSCSGQSNTSTRQLVCVTLWYVRTTRNISTLLVKKIYCQYLPWNITLKEKKKNTWAMCPSCALLKDAAGRYKRTQRLIMTHL